MPNGGEMATFRFEVAFSFAGAHRDTVRALAERVSAAIDPGLTDRSQGRVFFDEWFEHELLGSDMDVLLQNFYRRQSRMVVADLAEDYAGRKWPQAEARAVRDLRMELDTARDETARLRLLNIRLGEGEVPGVFQTEGYLDSQYLVQNPEHVPGVFQTEGYLDGRGKSPDECAGVILKRLALLRERMAGKPETTGAAGSAAFTPPPAGPEMGDPETAGSHAPRRTEVRAPAAERQRGWVWHATLASRAAGDVSVLACVESLFAVALYWWIAFHFQTHLHLLTSVFIAPLLLLRSPESIQTGVRWFQTDWFKDYERWPKGRQRLWLAAVALVSGGVTYAFAHKLSQHWLPGLIGWPLFGWSALIGVLSLGIAVAVVGAVAFMGEVAGSVAGSIAGAAAGAVVGAGAGAGAGAAAVVGAGAGAVTFGVAFAITNAGAGGFLETVASIVSVLLAGPGFAAGFVVRSLVCRVAATLRYGWAGVRQLPENWWENNGLTDLSIPPELLPGIRERDTTFALDGILKRFACEKESTWRLLWPVLGVIYFLPALVYRLNIKATAWFWWPLAFLLRPVPKADAQGQQKQLLCAPLTDPIERLWLIVSVLPVVFLVVHLLRLSDWFSLQGVPAVPQAFKVLLAVDWAHMAPWHWAQLVSAVAGLLMFKLAGHAVSQDRNGNWAAYMRECPQHLAWMTGLSRVRTLMTIGLLLMGLGALLVEYRPWAERVSLPAGVLGAWEEFYQLRR